jgi:predicted Ser/Thr protein kinase
MSSSQIKPLDSQSSIISSQQSGFSVKISPRSPSQNRSQNTTSLSQQSDSNVKTGSDISLQLKSLDSQSATSSPRKSNFYVKSSLRNANTEEKKSDSKNNNKQRNSVDAQMLASLVINYFELTFKQDDKGQKKTLGRGGFGTVYQGTWRYNDVAIKELSLSGISDTILSEFQNEAQVMAKLRSDYLVRFYGYCLSPKYCLVMEFLPGGSLYQLLHSDEPLDWSLRLQIAKDISRGIAFLHSEGILHRDIKSLNVLISQHSRAKLTDFGLSRIKTESATSTKGSVGTVCWMASELFQRNAKYTQKSDIYSMGVTFWEVASRKTPFADAQDPAVIPSWIMQGERDEIPSDCPKKFATLITACWKQKPEDRPTAAQVVNYLDSSEEDFSEYIKPKSVYLHNLVSCEWEAKTSN